MKFTRFKSLNMIFILLFFSVLLSAQGQYEFGVEHDLAVLGSSSSFADPNVEIKGFTVFGSTQTSYPGNIPAMPGNVVINGYLSVSSGSYFLGNSTFPSIGNIFINDGAPGYYVRKNSGGFLEWANPSTIGDNLGNHIATMTLNMANFAIDNVSSMTITATGVTGTDPLFKVAGTTMVVLNNGNVGIGTASPSEKLDIDGGVKVSSGIVTGKWIIGGCQNPNDPNDVMVPVGPWCVDKYEASVWSTPTGGTQYGASSDDYLCNDNGQDCSVGASNPIYARSVSGVTPSRYITWFQANIACFNAGKELLPNHVWQAAAAGTVDGSNCNTNGTGPSTTGSETDCQSTFGVESMIGSLWEWVAEWGTAGAGASNTEGTFVEFDGNGTGYNGDGNWNIGGKAYTNAPNPAGWITGLVPAVLRGGCWGDGASAGVFAFYAGDAPSSFYAAVGFRCGRRR